MVNISPLESDHFQTVADWLSTPEINRWLSSEWRGRTVQSQHIAIAVRNPRNKLYQVFFEKALCGLVAFSDLDAGDGAAMIWYFLGASEFAGQGITTEAVSQTVSVGFEKLGLSTIYAWTMEDNTASRRVLEKNSFHQAGRIRKAAMSGSKRVDRVYFDIVAGD